MLSGQTTFPFFILFWDFLLTTSMFLSWIPISFFLSPKSIKICPNNCSFSLLAMLWTPVSDYNYSSCSNNTFGVWPLKTFNRTHSIISFNLFTQSDTPFTSRTFETLRLMSLGGGCYSAKPVIQPILFENLWIIQPNGFSFILDVLPPAFIEAWNWLSVRCSLCPQKAALPKVMFSELHQTDIKFSNKFQILK